MFVNSVALSCFFVCTYFVFYLGFLLARCGCLGRLTWVPVEFWFGVLVVACLGAGCHFGLVVCFGICVFVWFDLLLLALAIVWLVVCYSVGGLLMVWLGGCVWWV